MIQRLGMLHIRTSAVHPSADGAAGRMVQSIKRILAKLVNKHWERMLPAARQAYVNRVHSATGFSLNTLFFGFQASGHPGWAGSTSCGAACHDACAGAQMMDSNESALSQGSKGSHFMDSNCTVVFQEHQCRLLACNTCSHPFTSHLETGSQRLQCISTCSCNGWLASTLLSHVPSKLSAPNELLMRPGRTRDLWLLVILF